MTKLQKVTETENNLETISMTKGLNDYPLGTYEAIDASNCKNFDEVQRIAKENKTDSTIKDCAGSQKDIIIPENVTRVGDSAFSSNKLQNIIIPKNVEEVKTPIHWEVLSIIKDL